MNSVVPLHCCVFSEHTDVVVGDAGVCVVVVGVVAGIGVVGVVAAGVTYPHCVELA